MEATVHLYSLDVLNRVLFLREMRDVMTPQFYTKLAVAIDRKAVHAP